MTTTHVPEPPVELLLADDDDGLLSLMSACARDTIDSLAVLEARDGAEALKIALQQQPPIALLDVHMPRLSGIEVALTLRELQPQTRVALHTAEPGAHRDSAREAGLPLFDKLQLDRAFRWVELQVRAVTPAKHILECAMCGYGVARATPPERCPMCQREDTWVQLPARLTLA